MFDKKLIDFVKAIYFTLSVGIFDDACKFYKLNQVTEISNGILTISYLRRCNLIPCITPVRSSICKRKKRTAKKNIRNKEKKLHQKH